MTKKGEEKICHAKRVFFFFLVWFQSRLGCHGYEVMAALGGKEVPSLGGGTWGWGCVPLHERTELNSADVWPRLFGDGERLHLM